MSRKGPERLGYAVAEFERTLIRERGKAGLRNAEAKGKHMGRSKVARDGSHIGRLNAQGLSWLKIVDKLVGDRSPRFASPLWTIAFPRRTE